SPWLWPIESDMYWMMPAAALLLCIPFFFASVWSEYFIARRLVSPELKSQALSWAWKANQVSYALMAILIVGMLIAGVAKHNSIANDDEHRSVDLISAERLWELAIPRVKQAREWQKSWRSGDKPEASLPGDISGLNESMRLLESETKQEDARLDD